MCNKGSYLCSCKSGYIASKSNPNKCEDIDECQTDNGGCLQKCDNIPGSFQCSCHHGYEGTYINIPTILFVFSITVFTCSAISIGVLYWLLGTLGLFV